MQAQKLLTASSETKEFLAVVYGSSPFISVYPWKSSTGFGSKLSNPASLPPFSPTDVSFSPSGYSLAISMASSPFINVYPWTATGFGVKYSNPAALPSGNSQTVTFSPLSDAVIVGTTSYPFVSAYPWSSAGFGTRYSAPAATTNSTVYGVAFSPDGTAVVYGGYNGGGSSNSLVGMPWNSTTGFGTKFLDPSPTYTSLVRTVKFSPAGNAVFVAQQSTPGIAAWAWSSSGFGTKYGSPALTPVDGTDVSVTSTGDYVALSEGGVDIDVIPWSYTTGFGTSVRNSTLLPSSAYAYAISFSKKNDAIAVGHTISPFVSAISFSAGSFGTKYSDPATLPALAVVALSFGAVG